MPEGAPRDLGTMDGKPGIGPGTEDREGFRGPRPKTSSYGVPLHASASGRGVQRASRSGATRRIGRTFVKE